MTVVSHAAMAAEEVDTVVTAAVENAKVVITRTVMVVSAVVTAEDPAEIVMVEEKADMAEIAATMVVSTVITLSTTNFLFFL